jgi:hypothetical protein
LNVIAPPRQLKRSVAFVPMATKPNLFGFSLFCGFGITLLLAVFAFGAGSRTMACTFAWQSCLLQAAVIPANSREGTPIDLFLFLFGLLLGVPIYSLLTYALLARRRKTRAQDDS